MGESFRINPEVRIEADLKMLNYADSNSFSD